MARMIIMILIRVEESMKIMIKLSYNLTLNGNMIMIILLYCTIMFCVLINVKINFRFNYSDIMIYTELKNMSLRIMRLFIKSSCSLLTQFYFGFLV